MKKPPVIFRHVFELAPILLLTGCQAIDNTFGFFGYLGISLISFVFVAIVVVNFTPGKILLRKLRSLFEKV
jgi:hypothetical protein